MAKWKHYEVKNNKLLRSKKTCPKCGDGVFMAEHKNRTSCGKCGYTEFKKTEKANTKSAKKQG